MVRMASLVDSTTERLAFDQSGVRDYRTNLQLPSTWPSSFRGIVRRGATVVDCAPKLVKCGGFFAGGAQVKKDRAERCAKVSMDLCNTARTGSGCLPTRHYSGRVSRPRLGFALIQNLLQSTTLNQHVRSIGVSRANTSFQLVVSFRQIVYRLLLQLYCLACAPESASRAARLSRAVCFSVSDCVCARCASSCLPSLPLPPCDALARSW
jgi:hypothetical protein